MLLRRPALFCLSLLSLLTCAAPADAQLWQTPATTAAQPALRGYALRGTVLTQGPTRITLDTAGGRVVGVLIETPDLNALARGIVAAWGGTEQALPQVSRWLAQPGVQAKARRGFTEPSDENGVDTLTLRLSGTGTSLRWRAYVAINILPEKAFTPTRNVTGQASAPNSIHILSDFQCPACLQAWQQIIPQWRKQPALYRISYHHFPLSYHRNAFPAAEAGECAAQQGKFWAYADALFKNYNAWTPQDSGQLPPAFKSYATQVGLNRARFDTCLTSHQTRGEVSRQMVQGQRVYLTGTPTIYLNGIKLTEMTGEELKLVQAMTRARPSAQSVIAGRLASFK